MLHKIIERKACSRSSCLTFSHRYAAQNAAQCVFANASGKGDDSTTPYKGDENAPILHFLKSEKGLYNCVDPTIKKCEELLQLVKSAENPQEKHDLLDSTSNVLCLLLDPCEFVRQLHPDENYKKFANESFSKGHEYMCEVNGRRELYDVLVDIASPESQKLMTAESNKNVTQLKRDMESNGIHLPDAKRKVIEELNIEKEELAMKFFEEGDGKNPIGVLTALLDCRWNLAKKLGFECFAEQQLRGTMLKNQQKVWHFLCGLAQKYRPQCEEELRLITKNIGEVRSRQNVTDVQKAVVSASLRNNAEPKEIAYYFTVANCIRGIQCLCSENFGIHLVEKPFAPDELFLMYAKKFYVYDEKKEFMGVIIVDMFARSTKYCQAAHLTVQLGCRPHVNVLQKVGIEMNERQYPVVVLTCNAGSSIAPALLNDGTPDPEGTIMLPYEVNTFFHEFGHALHTILGQTSVQNLAGTRGSIDYVETFSQLFEQFLQVPEFLQLWAHKLGTKEKIPTALIEKRNDAANMFQHLEMLDQIQLSVIDQVLHGPQPFTVYFPFEGKIGKRTLGMLSEYGKGMFKFGELLTDISKPIALATPTTHGVLRTLSFEHISSYPAGYYGYLYSLTVAKRIWHKKFKNHPLNRDAGKELVDKVMKYGAACDPVQTIQNYLGDSLEDIDMWS